MARRLSAKQIKAGFGGKRRQNNAKKRRKSAASHRPRSKKNPARKVITGYGSTVMNKGRRKKRRAANPAGKTNVVFNRGKKKRVARKRNLGGIFALTGNPAKGRKSMARTKKRKTSSKAHRSAGTRKSRRSNPGRHRRRSNPGQFGSPADWLSGGAGVLAGVVGTRSLPQLVLGASNTGIMGYFANAATTGILTFLAHMAMPKNRVFSASVLAGGAAALISRVIGDYSLLGTYSSQAGLGDYLFNFNFATPQILGGDRRAIVGAGMPGPVSTPVAVGSTYGANLY